MSSQEVSITSRTRRSSIYPSSRKTTKQEETPCIKAPTRRTNQRGTYIKLHHLEKWKALRVKSSSKSIRRKQLEQHQDLRKASHQVFKKKASSLQLKLYQVSICPLLSIPQCLFARKVTNWLGPLHVQSPTVWMPRVWTLQKGLS